MEFSQNNEVCLYCSEDDYYEIAPVVEDKNTYKKAKQKGQDEKVIMKRVKQIMNEVTNPLDRDIILLLCSVLSAEDMIRLDRL